ncbi:MAG TPA: hypothetical protein VFJ47_11675 [Terriglobales bacterium]|nr:hypothetical protein [Terriglobales bacterium]
MAKIRGTEGMSAEQINFEIQRGAKYVLFYYTISILVLTFRRSSDIYFVRAGESRVAKGLPWTVLTLLCGWWGIPWGPIYSVQSLVINLGGGKDVTQELMAASKPMAAKAATASKS